MPGSSLSRHLESGVDPGNEVVPTLALISEDLFTPPLSCSMPWKKLILDDEGSVVALV